VTAKARDEQERAERHRGGAPLESEATGRGSNPLSILHHMKSPVSIMFAGPSLCAPGRQARRRQSCMKKSRPCLRVPREETDETVDCARTACSAASTESACTSRRRLSTGPAHPRALRDG